MHVDPHCTLAELDEMIGAERSPGVARQLTAIRSAMHGDTAPDIAKDTGASEQAVRGWVERYKAAGAPSPWSMPPGRGRKGPLGADQRERLKARLLADPTAGDGGCTLRGEDVRRIPADEFGVARSMAATYDLLHPPRDEHASNIPARHSRRAQGGGE